MTEKLFTGTLNHNKNKNKLQTIHVVKLCAAMSVHTSQTYVSKPHNMCEHTDEPIHPSIRITRDARRNKLNVQF